ncbi:hypothetical protein FRX31_034552 [Thalictrum thalictroides]|uniref:Uncharacterized protein n=1 Tax=Thalictrum thalictroides TaxID=46969 RepID=A0A7J6UTR8_THATH|nr:hypothetical protein FRX31_034552 [Thalictrum thalictroides]
MISISFDFSYSKKSILPNTTPLDQCPCMFGTNPACSCVLTIESVLFLLLPALCLGFAPKRSPVQFPSGLLATGYQPRPQEARISQGAHKAISWSGHWTPA